MSLHAFPRQLTSFVGRERETTEIVAQLQQQSCRLLTLVGPGGMGKTRLAIQVSTALQADFDAIHFVALQAVEAPEQLPYAIADALGVGLADHDPVAQLIDLLQDATRLLVLDNFEQLLEAADLLADLLYAVPHLKLLVTSREVLNLQEEWVYPVEGLRRPDDSHAALDAYDASRLFVERAHRVDPHFDATGQAAAIVEICRLVGGTPLAIELAATWARSLTCDAIAAEIHSSLHFLTSHQRNIPERHRSMRAVFDRSWAFLSPVEQAALRRLAVFQGGFQRDAAQAVAEAALPIITALVDKSLVRVAAPGRYQLHELVRQYAWEKLAEHADELRTTRRQHAQFYLGTLDARRREFGSRNQLALMQEIAADFENVRVAWYTAIEQLRYEEIRLAVDPLQHFLDAQSRFVECTELLGAAYTALDAALAQETVAQEAANLALGRVGVPYAWALLRLGRLREAAACAERSLRIYTDFNIATPAGLGTDPRTVLAFVMSIRGDYVAACSLGAEALERIDPSDDPENWGVARYVLGTIHAAMGDYDAAAQHFQHAHMTFSEVGNGWMEAYVVAEMGRVAMMRNSYVEAQQYFEACYALKEQYKDPQGMASALVGLGKLALRRGDVDAAHSAYARSEALYRKIHDRGGLITTLQGQCDVALREGNLEAAIRKLREAFSVVQQTNLLPFALSLLVTGVGLLCRLEDDEPCADLLATVLGHPGCDHETRLYAQETAQSLGMADLLPRVADAPVPAWEELLQIINNVQTRLMPGVPAAVAVAPNGVELAQRTGTADKPRQPLVEPLTDRELEVLALLADGLTNQDIADELIIAIGTVKSYTSHIYGKLAVSNRTQAILRARELGII